MIWSPRKGLFKRSHDKLTFQSLEEAKVDLCIPKGYTFYGFILIVPLIPAKAEVPKGFFYIKYVE